MRSPDRPSRRWLRPLAWVAAALALAAALSAWRDPHLALALANQLWACF